MINRTIVCWMMMFIGIALGFVGLPLASLIALVVAATLAVEMLIERYGHGQR